MYRVQLEPSRRWLKRIVHAIVLQAPCSVARTLLRHGGPISASEPSARPALGERESHPVYLTNSTLVILPDSVSMTTRFPLQLQARSCPSSVTVAFTYDSGEMEVGSSARHRTVPS